MDKGYVVVRPHDSDLGDHPWEVVRGGYWLGAVAYRGLCRLPWYDLIELGDAGKLDANQIKLYERASKHKNSRVDTYLEPDLDEILKSNVLEKCGLEILYVCNYSIADVSARNFYGFDCGNGVLSSIIEGKFKNPDLFRTFELNSNGLFQSRSALIEYNEYYKSIEEDHDIEWFCVGAEWYKYGIFGV